LQDERGCDICGVEITDDAQPVTAHPFRRSTAFLFGNEVGGISIHSGTGLSQKECDICDFFVYIPQYGGGTASLNVTVAASIVLHHFGAANSRIKVVAFELNCFVEMQSVKFPSSYSTNRMFLSGCHGVIIFCTLWSIHLISFAWLSAVWAGFPERGRESNKFIVADKPQGHSRGLYCTESIEAVIEERKMRKENACDILEENGSSHPQESNGLELMFTDETATG
ncbi:hypothetical protein BAE44_0010017, partial [Dichanthelium oligosanthes]